VQKRGQAFIIVTIRKTFCFSAGFLGFWDKDKNFDLTHLHCFSLDTANYKQTLIPLAIKNFREMTLFMFYSNGRNEEKRFIEFGEVAVVSFALS
jgi:hypothetical protein